jgi:nucleotide-binding universal stress UspA family protein
LPGIEVVLLHVYSPSESDVLPMRRAYIKQAAKIIRHQFEEKTDGVREIKVQGELAKGYPSEEILRYAEKNDINLILMATHGRSGISRWAMGSVAYKVLRASNVPVWLVRAGIPEEIIKLPVGKILVPLDGTKLAELVLPHVERLANQWSAGPVEVVLLRVCEPPVVSSDYPAHLPLSWEEHLEQETVKSKLVARPYLSEVEKRLRDTGLRVSTEVQMGKAADEIIDYARRNSFSLIAMIIHGRSGISRWAYGSVAEKVMLGAYTPVFLVRPQ